MLSSNHLLGTRTSEPRQTFEKYVTLSPDWYRKSRENHASGEQGGKLERGQNEFADGRARYVVEPVDSLNKLLASMQLVDLAPRLERGMPRWPTHPHFVLDKTMTHAHDGYYCQSLAMPEHLGCHCDAPAHSLADTPKATIDCLSLRHFLAPAVIYDFSALNLDAGELIDASHIEQMEQESGIRVGPNEIALVNFGWLRRYWRTDDRAQWYAQNSPGMTEAAVRLFASRGLRAVGADTIACEVPIVDGIPGDNPGHMKHWLPNGILIVECVANLEKVAKRAFFAALPLPIAEGSGSPLRPIALF